jgi:CheY-like chemotaxis protein
MLKVLIADDDPDSLIIMESLFKNSFPDVQVFEATNGAIALDLCSRHHFDLICTDFNMPVLNGLEFIQTLRHTEGLNRNTRVIMISGNVVDFEKAAQALPDVCVLNKPIRFDRIFSCLS